MVEVEAFHLRVKYVLRSVPTRRWSVGEEAGRRRAARKAILPWRERAVLRTRPSGDWV